MAIAIPLYTLTHRDAVSAAFGHNLPQMTNCASKSFKQHGKMLLRASPCPVEFPWHDCFILNLSVSPSCIFVCVCVYALDLDIGITDPALPL